MLDPKFFQDSVDELEKGLRRRHYSSENVKTLVEMSRRRKDLIQEVEGLKSHRNRSSQEIGVIKSKIKGSPDSAARLNQEADAKMAEVRTIGDKIKVLDETLRTLEQQFLDATMRIPNLPHQSVPEGADAASNLEVRKWGEIPHFNFTAKDHVALGERLGILDFDRAGKLSGARFALYMKGGAALERALIQFMLDLHTTENKYTEVIPPFLVNRETMTGTGQLPKFQEDLFKTGVEDRELFLIPTAEVPLTNMHRDEILESSKLPLRYVAFSPCFRSEAGSYGKDTRGLIRQHQFQKVELVKITEPEQSYNELELMVQNAERVLQLLELPYRVILLCAGDMGFSAAKTYDLEVWLPGQNAYREISSCSNCEDFQARRMALRYRPNAQDKPKLVHTLNGSGLAAGRTFIAVLENYQDDNGNIRIPKVLERHLTGRPEFVQEHGSLWLKA